MDVDRARIVLTDEEMQRCKSEGRCFRCFGQGHLSRDCPKKTNRAQGGVTTLRAQDARRGLTTARVAEVDSATTPATTSTAAPPATPSTAGTSVPSSSKIDKRGFAAQVRMMKNEEKEEILDSLFDDPDFS